MKLLWEILVPASSGVIKIAHEHHKKWDNKVNKITKGLTILSSVKGEWISPTGELFKDKMIPVRIMATKKEMITIVDMTAKHYKQQAVMYYVISNEVNIKYFTKEK